MAGISLKFTIRGILLDSEGCKLTLLTDWLKEPFTVPVDEKTAQEAKIGNVLWLVSSDELRPHNGTIRRRDDGKLESFKGIVWEEIPEVTNG